MAGGLGGQRGGDDGDGSRGGGSGSSGRGLGGEKGGDKGDGNRGGSNYGGNYGGKNEGGRGEGGQQNSENTGLSTGTAAKKPTDEITRKKWGEWQARAPAYLADLQERIGKWASPSRIKQQVGLSAADVKQSYGKARSGFMDSLSRYGLNPGSGKFAGGLRALALGEAADTAGAKTTTRTGILDRDLENRGKMASLLMQQDVHRDNLGLRRHALDQEWLQHKDRIKAGMYSDRKNAEGGLWSGIGSLIGGLFSDERMKQNMIEIGDMNGIKVYQFQYLDEPHTTYTGVSAQQLMDVKPHLVGEIGGFLTVDYLRLIDEVMDDELRMAA